MTTHLRMAWRKLAVAPVVEEWDLQSLLAAFSPEYDSPVGGVEADLRQTDAQDGRPGYLDDLAAKLRQGNPIEPVDVLSPAPGEEDTEPMLMDGHHRVIAAKLAGRATAPVRYHFATMKDGEPVWPTYVHVAHAKLAGATEMGEVVQAHLGECFGTVNEFVLGRKLRGDANWRVVHGHIQGEVIEGTGFLLPKLHHAFAQHTQTREVYEPSTDTVYDGDAFKRLFRPTFDEVFEPGEWERACVWYGHHGPWDGSAPPIAGGKGYGQGAWRRTASWGEQSLEACSTCGLSFHPDTRVLGSMGCGRCYRTLPYRAWPSRRQANRIEFSTTPWWMTDTGRDTVVRPVAPSDRWDPNHAWSATINTPGGNHASGGGRTAQQAIDAVMLEAAKQSNLHWEPISKANYDAAYAAGADLR